MDYNTLLHRYNQLLQKYEILKAENTKLRSSLSLKDENKKSEKSFPGATITKHSSSDSKIALFRSLFCGREDVFARRWYSKSTEKSGYQPVCKNEWADGLCDKRKHKCSVCLNRKLVQLTDDDIFKHLAGKDEYGRDVVGIYPMLKDETCNFFAPTSMKKIMKTLFPHFVLYVKSLMFLYSLSGHVPAAVRIFGYFLIHPYRLLLRASLEADFLQKQWRAMQVFLLSPTIAYFQIRIPCRKAVLAI